ncbi:hypothetical protein [Parasaccharibacter sp. TMW2.1890]|uniref:hypothetical protein n=1 Tax=Parasaccharibacter sp. TMW2.1890 TaxID=2039289 RepID=UPI002011AF63|nr:hypothetical protein [Parasaccharibacter sp. TMW2.1890]
MMFRRMATFALIASALTSQVAFAASHGKAHHCRNEKGQFTKCEKPKAKPCRDKNGKFSKCNTQDAASAKPSEKAEATADSVKDSSNPMKSDMPATDAAAPATH